MLKQPLNKYIDHTLLKPDATIEQLENLLEEAAKFEFSSVCVSPTFAGILGEINTKVSFPFDVCTVAGFPHGNIPTEMKLQEAFYFIERGVKEIDFVINYGELKNNNLTYVVNEIKRLSDVCAERKVVSKFIVETCYLTREEKIAIFNWMADFCPNADFIKTSTGFGLSGAQLEDVALWSELRLRNELQGDKPGPLIKAAGGIKDLNTALAFIEAGAHRLGMSTGVKVMEEYLAHEKTFTEGATSS